MSKLCFSALFLISPAEKYIVDLFNGYICPNQYIVTDSLEDAVKETQNIDFDFIVVDVERWDVEEVQELLATRGCQSIIAVADKESILKAIHAMKVGATNFIIKEDMSYNSVAKVVKAEAIKQNCNRMLTKVSNKLSTLDKIKKK